MLPTGLKGEMLVKNARGGHGRIEYYVGNVMNENAASEQNFFCLNFQIGALLVNFLNFNSLLMTA